MRMGRWYTDLMDVYRTEDYKDGSLAKKRRVPVLSAVPCRLYRGERPTPRMQQTAASVEYINKLMIDPDVDLQAGDEIFITRGGNLPEGRRIDRAPLRFFAGQPYYYDDRLPHQEVGLSREART